MAGTLNKVMLIGNIGKDPEIRNINDGKRMASFSLATSDSWKDKNTGDQKEKTEWHKVAVFVPHLVDIIEKYVKKGTKIYIEGSLQTRRWMDNASTERYVTEVLLQSPNSVLVLLSGRNNSSVDHSAPSFDVLPFSGKPRTSDNHMDEDFIIEELKEDDVPF